MKLRTLTLLASLAVATSPALADNLRTRVAVGSGLAGVVGAIVGDEIGGRDGAIIGSGVGAVVGALIATDGYERYEGYGRYERRYRHGRYARNERYGRRKGVHDLERHRFHQPSRHSDRYR